MADTKRTECPICEKDVPVNKDGTIRAHRWRADRCHASGLTVEQARDSIRGLAEVPPPTEPERGEIVQHPAPQPEGGQLVPAAGSAIDAAVSAAMAMPGMPGMDEFLSLAMQARILSMSGAAPAHIRNHPHIAFHVAMIGRDLGISPTAAIQLIDVIGRDDDPNPQLSLSPELLNGQIRRLGLGAIRPLKRTMFECIAGAYGPDGELLGESEFDWADAVVAGLADDRCQPNQHWVPTSGNGRCRCRQGYRTYPKRMLWWRASGFAAQDYFPEAGLGLYCLSTRAEALTRSGWRTHDKLAIGDEILAFNNDTGVCEWTPVRATRVYEAAQTYRVEHARWAVTATAEHRWIMQRKGWKGTPDPGREFRTTDTIRRGGGSVLLAAPAVDEPTLLTDREAAIIGWLLTDGSFRWREDLGRGGAISAAIQQSKHVEAVRSLFHDGEMSERVAVEAGVQVIHGKGHLCREHRVFKLRAAFAKHLLGKVGMRTKADAELAVTRLSSSARKAMFDAMLLANGSDAANGPTGQRHVSFFTGHEPVMRAFLALCSLLGQATGRQRWAGKCWVVTLRRSVGVDAASLTVTPHDVEPVWCPTTDFGTWVARVDGYVFMTGNSPEALGAVVGPDGRPIDPTQVELPDGYGPGPGHGNGQARGLPVDTRADGAELWQLQARAWALPDEFKRQLRQRREQTPALRTDGGVIPLWQLPDRGLRIAKSLLAGLESQAERGDDGWDRAEALDAVHRHLAYVLTDGMASAWPHDLPPAAENPDSAVPPPRDPEPAGGAPAATQAPLSEQERKAALVTPEIIEWIKTLPGSEVEALLDQAKVDWAGKTDPEKRMLLALEEADARAGEP